MQQGAGEQGRAGIVSSRSPGIEGWLGRLRRASKSHCSTVTKQTSSSAEGHASAPCQRLGIKPLMMVLGKTE